MATFRKLLKNRNGDTIIPVVDLMEDYSTSEVNTGRKWIDGSTIYKKTLNFGALPNNASKSMSTGVANLKRVLRFEGFSWSGTTQLILPYLAGGTDNTANVGMGWLAATNEIRVVTGSNRTNYTETYITIYYIKS